MNNQPVLVLITAVTIYHVNICWQYSQRCLAAAGMVFQRDTETVPVSILTLTFLCSLMLSTSNETDEQNLSFSQSPDDVHLSEESELPATLHKEAMAHTGSSSRPVHIILNEAISGLKEIQ